MFRKGKKINTYPSPTLPYLTQQATGYRLLVVGKVQYSMYSTRFDRWVGKVGKLVGKVVENGLLGIFPLEHSFYYRPIQVINPWNVCT